MQHGEHHRVELSIWDFCKPIGAAEASYVNMIDGKPVTTFETKIPEPLALVVMSVGIKIHDQVAHLGKFI